MQIALAPMEGLVDEILRDVLTRVGGIDWCVTEFIRITDRLLPATAFHKLAPELRDGSRTRAGTPMRVQLLGSDPACLADNAAFACELGAPVIDLNFGCPAKTVNRSRGGAVLLKEPELMHDIVAAVRRAVPSEIAVTSKMRLGYDSPDGALDCARALADGGSAHVVVHARTKVDGYRPPAHWEWVARVAEAVRVPVFANGEVWTLDDYLRCREVSGVEDIMLGRGLVSRPAWLGRSPPGAMAAKSARCPGAICCRCCATSGCRPGASSPRAMPRAVSSSGWACSPAPIPKPSSCSHGYAGKAIAKPSTGCCRCRSARRPSLRTRPSGRR